VDAFERHAAMIRKELAALSHKHGLVFAASCCDRALPNYATFSAQEGFGDPAVLRAALDRVWQQPVDGSLSPVEVTDLLAQCKPLVPHSDAFSSPDAAAAQDAGLSLLVLLEYCRDPDPEHALRVAAFSRDTIDMVVQLHDELDPAAPDFEERVLSHPLMRREFAKQAHDIEELKAARTLTPEFIREFRRLTLPERKSNIGIVV